MKLKVVLRAAVIAQWGVIFAVVPIALLRQPHLPPELYAWVVSESKHPIDLIATISITNLLLYLVASVGLCFLKRWAAWLYLISAIVSLSFDLRGPKVQGAIDAFGSEITSILAGIVIGVAFFTDVTKKTKSSIG